MQLKAEFHDRQNQRPKENLVNQVILIWYADCHENDSS